MLRNSLLIVCLIVFACKEDDTEKKCTQLVDSTAWTSIDQAQLSKDIQAIDDYLTANSQTAIADPSGIRYRITKTDPTAVGTPCLESKILVKYTGVLMSSSNVFEEVTSGTTFTLSNLIPGWKIPFLKFTKGTTATLYIPSGLAYGATGNTKVPPNANLIFFIELVDFK